MFTSAQKVNRDASCAITWPALVSGLCKNGRRRRRLSRISFFYATLFFLHFAAAGEPDIVLGQIASVSNAAIANSSRDLQRGYQLYFDKFNAKGGLDGRKIRLIEKDDDFNAQKTLNLTKELIEVDQVLALVGYLGTPGSALLAKAGILTGNGIAMIAPSCGATGVLSKPNMFPVRASYEAEMTQIAQQAQAMRQTRIALLAWSAGAGPALAKEWPAIVREAGLESVENQSFDTSLDPKVLQDNVDNAVLPIMKIKPDAVFVIASGNALNTAVQSIRKTLPASMPIYSLSTASWQDMIRQIGLKAATGVIISQAVPYPYSPLIPIVRDYLNDMKIAGKGDLPSYYGLEGYLGAALTVEALRRARPTITRHSILDALIRMGHTEIGGVEVSYSAVLRQGYATPMISIITRRGDLVQ